MVDDSAYSFGRWWLVMVMNATVWSESPTALSTGPILKLCKIVNFNITLSIAIDAQTIGLSAFGARNIINSNLFCFTTFVC